VLGQWRFRCLASEACELYRKHRRRQQTESAKRIEHGPTRSPARRRSVAELQRFYTEWEGDGYQAALCEARELLAVGADLIEAAEWIGFSAEELRAAVERTEHE